MIAFKIWLENKTIKIPLHDLIISKKALIKGFNNIKDGRESRTYGPIEVWQINDKYQIVDGYHRVIDAIINGKETIESQIIGQGYPTYYYIAKPNDQFHYEKSINYNDLQNLADQDLLDQLGVD